MHSSRMIYMCLVFTALLPLPLAYSAESKGQLVIVEGIASGSNIGSEDACKMAKLDAMQNAVSSAATMIISVQQYENDLLVMDYLKARSQGYVTQPKFSDCHTSVDNDNQTNKPLLVCKVSLSATVEVPEAAEQKVHLRASLNSKIFKKGEYLTIEVTTVDDCYVYIYNLTADKMVVPIFPNLKQGDNFLRHGSTLVVPDPKVSKMKLKVAPEDGKTESKEAIVVYGFPEKISLDRVYPPGKPVSLFDFNATLVTYPVGSSDEKILIYRVFEN